MSKTHKGYCFTSRYSAISNQLANDVKIASAVKPNGEDNFEFPSKMDFSALWDTGATCSLITPNVAKQLGLVSLGKGHMKTPSGETQTNKYYINVLLPNNCAVQKLEVLEGIPAGFDMLIGMDIIRLGDFAVTNHSGKTTFSFRMPSACEIDFVNHSYMTPREVNKVPRRNEPCSCGSGKKYKNCCGSND
jgi:hypothetical protein